MTSNDEKSCFVSMMQGGDENLYASIQVLRDRVEEISNHMENEELRARATIANLLNQQNGPMSLEAQQRIQNDHQHQMENLGKQLRQQQDDLQPIIWLSAHLDFVLLRKEDIVNGKKYDFTVEYFVASVVEVIFMTLKVFQTLNIIRRRWCEYGSNTFFSFKFSWPAKVIESSVQWSCVNFYQMPIL